MIKKFSLCILFVIMSCCVSCSGDEINTKPSSQVSISASSFDEQPQSDAFDTYRPFSQQENDFDSKMRRNPIDAQMNSDLSNTELVSTRDFQVFYDKYVRLWIEELEFSVANFEKRCSVQQCNSFKESQRLWQESVDSSSEFKRNFISDSQISLGTQYVPDALIYLMNQYKDRVFYVKYLTYLVEGMENSNIPENEQTWNTFLI